MARTAAKPKKAIRVTSAHVREHRENSKKDRSPTWDGCENWDGAKFTTHFRAAMAYYRLEYDNKAYKAAVLSWMAKNGYSKSDINAFKATKDWRVTTTMGSIASCLLRGMLPVKAEFNNGKNTSQWLGLQVAKVIEEGRNDIEPEEKAAKPAGPVVSIQDRTKDAALGMTSEIEDALEAFHKSPNTFNPKEFKVLNCLKGNGAKAAHARIIRDFYSRNLAEIEEVLGTKVEEQLKEAYSHRSKKQLKLLLEFYKEIDAACVMLAEEAKVNRVPRAKKPVAKDKLVAKLKYLKTFETLKLVSINPTDIVGAKELWVYNTKTRKLGKYVAGEFADLSVKGTSITGFDETKSIQKTLRKPAEQIKAFKDAGKVALRKFLEDINAVDTKLNGRLNEETILLKIA